MIRLVAMMMLVLAVAVVSQGCPRTLSTSSVAPIASSSK